MSTSTDVMFSVRMPSGLRERMHELATCTGRSTTREARLALEIHLARAVIAVAEQAPDVPGAREAAVAAAAALGKLEGIAYGARGDDDKRALMGGFETEMLSMN